MFNEVHMSSSINGIQLAFAKSLSVSVFPCGRRRSELANNRDLNADGVVTEDEKYYIPFDPEARLNTEANNRKHSSLNGFTQTYINKWDIDNGLLSIVLSGYLFNFKLTSEYHTPATFSTKLLEKLDTTQTVDKIFANIRIENTLLFSGNGLTHETGVLRNQSGTEVASTSLDLLTSTAGNTTSTYQEDLANYYFSGISFSTKALSEHEGGNTDVAVILDNDGNIRQYVISLLLLKKDEQGTWSVNQSSLLPHIEHGPTEDSIKTGTIYAESINFYNSMTGELLPGGVPILNVEDIGNNTYQLQFSYTENQ